MKSINGWWIPAEDGGEEREYKWDYLNREYGIKLFYGKNQKKVQLENARRGKTTVIVMDNSVTSLDFLSDFPKRSVTALFVSDETYSAIKTCKLLRHPSIKIVFRDYPLQSIRGLFSYPKLFISSVTMLIKYERDVRAWFAAFVSGIAMMGKQVAMRSISKLSRKEIRHLPLGYTGNFASNYSESFSLNEKESLITHAIKGIASIEMLKKREETFFAGQRGKFDRRVFLNSARSLKLNVTQVHETYGGPLDVEERSKAQKNYFYGLLNSRFSICPSGNYSVESFRYLESLLVQTLPIVPRTVLSDPLYFNYSIETWGYQDAEWFRNFPEVLRISLIKQKLEKLDSRIKAIIAELRLNEVNS